MLKILIPVDGSEHARKAINAVAKLASPPAEIEVMLLHVSHRPAPYGEQLPSAYASSMSLHISIKYRSWKTLQPWLGPQA